MKTPNTKMKESSGNLIANVVRNHSSCSTSVVHGSETVKPFLTSSVPYLKMGDCVIANSKILGQEGG